MPHVLLGAFWGLLQANCARCVSKAGALYKSCVGGWGKFSTGERPCHAELGMLPLSCRVIIRWNV